MDLPFLRFYTLFNLGVVVWLYGFFSLFTAASLLKISAIAAERKF